MTYHLIKTNEKLIKLKLAVLRYTATNNVN